MTTTTTQRSPAPRRLVTGFSAWLMAIRPKTLSAAVVPVLVGAATANAHGTVDIVITAVALLVSLLLQVGSNFANDVYDYERGADTAERLGPKRAVASGVIAPSTMKRAMLIVLSLALCLGTYIGLVTGPVLFGIGLLAIVCAVAYTGGPYPLGYNGLGDICVFFFFGLVAVAGTVYLSLGRLPAVVWWAAVPVGSLATCILVVNNVRDYPTDVKAGKRTLVVRFGLSVGLLEYRVLLALAYVCLGVLAWLQSSAAPLLPIVTLPLALRLAREIEERTGEGLNQTLTKTAALLTSFGLLLALGIALSAAAALSLG